MSVHHYNFSYKLTLVNRYVLTDLKLNHSIMEIDFHFQTWCIIVDRPVVCIIVIIKMMDYLLCRTKGNGDKNVSYYFFMSCVFTLDDH